MVFTRSKTRANDVDVVIIEDWADAELQRMNLGAEVLTVIRSLNLNQLVCRNSKLLSAIASGSNVYEADDKANETEYVVLIGLLERISKLKTQRIRRQAVVIGPNYEACERITRNVETMNFMQLNVVNLNVELPLKKLKCHLDSSPDILIATLPMLLLNLQLKFLKLNESLHFLAINKVDSILTTEYEDDVKEFSCFLPIQSFQRVILASKIDDRMTRLNSCLYKPGLEVQNGNNIAVSEKNGASDSGNNVGMKLAVYFKAEEEQDDEPIIINQAVEAKAKTFEESRSRGTPKHLANKGECYICHKYISKDLYRHIKFHTCKRPFKCEYCEKAYTNQNALVIHIRTHTNERPFKCGKCEKAFACLQYLKVHQSKHSNNRLFQCQFCSNSFKYSSHMSLHTRREHNIFNV